MIKKIKSLKGLKEYIYIYIYIYISAFLRTNFIRDG